MEEFIKICRMCFCKDEKLLSITTTVGTNCKILDYFKKYLQINMSTDDNFPKNICLNCFNKLLEVRKFYLQCHNSENYLKLKYKNQISNSKLVNEQNVLDENTLPEDSTYENKLKVTENSNLTKSELNEEDVELDLIDKDNQEIEKNDESKELGNFAFCEIPAETTTENITKTNSKLKKNYTCKICNESFNKRVIYNIHMKQHATKKWSPNESSICPICGKLFEKKRNMQKHIYNHNKVLRASCTICNKAFTSKYHLALHMNKHTGAKPFKCNVCNNNFAAPSSLRIHKALHYGKKFECTMCDTKFAERAQIKRHMRKHTNERPYECSKCPKTFKESKGLKVHQAVHADVKSKVHKPKRFHCNKCEKQFATKNQIKSHLLSIHKICVEDFSSYDITKVEQ